jgi:hypothetical protein
VVRALVLVVALVSSGCFGSAGPAIPTSIPPEARTAYAADQVVIRLNEFQTFVIDATLSGQIPLPLGRQIVQWLITTRTIIGQTPNGWQVQALVGWNLLKDELARVPQLAPWVPLINELILGFT